MIYEPEIIGFCYFLFSVGTKKIHSKIATILQAIKKN